MKNTMRCLVIIALAAVIGFSFIACDGLLNGLNGDGDDNGGGSNLSLDGVWRQTGGIRVVTISGSTGTLTSINTTEPLFLDAVDKGYWAIGSIHWRNLTSRTNLTWSGQWSVVMRNTSNPDVATGTSWESGIWTLSADGQTLLVGQREGEAGSTWTRQSGGGDGDIDSSLYGTWRTDDHTLIVTFASNYISWNGIVGDSEWVDYGQFGRKWTAKNGAISYAYGSYDPEDTTTIKAYDYNIASGNLILTFIGSTASNISAGTKYTLTKDDGSGTSGNFKYSYKASKVIITGYTGNGGAVTIPSTIDGKSVVAIESYAFSTGYSTIGAYPGIGLTGVTIPNSVTAIYYGAFYGNELTSVTIGANVNLGNYYNDKFYSAFYRDGGGGFESVYNNGGKLAGTYTSSNGWARQ